MLNIIPKPYKAEELPGKADARGGFNFAPCSWDRDTARFLKNISPSGGARLAVATEENSALGKEEAFAAFFYPEYVGQAGIV